MSPMPGRSILITSAPNQARSWVQVGPDCTCVKSRMRTPCSALPSMPNGFGDGLGRPLPFAFAATFFFALRTVFAAFTALRAGFRAAAFVFFAVLDFFLAIKVLHCLAAVMPAQAGIQLLDESAGSPLSRG